MTISTSHVRAEDAGLDRDAERAELGAEPFDERLRLLGRRGSGEARAVALRGVGDQRELGDDERGAAGVEEAAVELPVVVGEHAQPRDLAREPCGRVVVVAGRDAEQNAEAGADLARDYALHRHPGRADALTNGSHARRSVVR